MDYSPDAIAAERAAATADADRAEIRAHVAAAVATMATLRGLRYTPLDPDHSVYLAACDGRVLGYLWPGAAGTVLGGWTCAPLGATERLGPFHTARAAVAGLARACHVAPA